MLYPITTICIAKVITPLFCIGSLLYSVPVPLNPAKVVFCVPPRSMDSALTGAFFVYWCGMTYYHYTIRFPSHLGSILSDKLIKPTPDPFYWCPVAWISTNPLFEWTAWKLGAKDENKNPVEPLEKHLEIAARIVISPALPMLSFSEWKRIGPDHFKLNKNKRREFAWFAERLEKCGRRWGANPDEWFCRFDGIHDSWWEDIEIFKDGDWVSALVKQEMETNDVYQA